MEWFNRRRLVVALVVCLAVIASLATALVYERKNVATRLGYGDFKIGEEFVSLPVIQLRRPVIQLRRPVIGSMTLACAPVHENEIEETGKRAYYVGATRNGIRIVRFAPITIPNQ